MTEKDKKILEVFWKRYRDPENRVSISSISEHVEVYRGIEVIAKADLRFEDCSTLREIILNRLSPIRYYIQVELYDNSSPYAVHSAKIRGKETVNKICGIIYDRRRSDRLKAEEEEMEALNKLL